MRADTTPSERARMSIEALMLARVGRNDYPALASAEIVARSMRLDADAARWTDREHEAARRWAERVYVGGEHALAMPAHVEALPWVDVGLGPIDLGATLHGLSEEDGDLVWRLIARVCYPAWYLPEEAERAGLDRLFACGLVARRPEGERHRFRLSAILVHALTAWGAEVSSQAP